MPNATLVDASSVPVGTATNPLAVTPVASGVDQDVNIAAVAGVATPVGHGVAATALRVELPTDGTGVVGLNASEAHVGQVGGKLVVASANFTRPANTDPYASGDIVANSVTAGSVTPMSFSVARVSGGSGMVRRARLRKTDTSTTNAAFRLHLYSGSPGASNGDGAAWLTSLSGYMGSIDITADKVFTANAAGQGVPGVGVEMSFVATALVIYGLLEARAAYTPASAEVFTLELEVIQN